MKSLLLVFVTATVFTVVSSAGNETAAAPSNPAADAAADAQLLQTLLSMPKVTDEIDVELIKFNKLEKGTFIQALAACKSEGMDLVEARSETRSNQLYVKILKESLLAKTESMWLAATDAYIEGQWLWLRNGDPLVYKDFSKGEPNNYAGKEHCLAITKNAAGEIGWNDLACEMTLKIVCQKKKDPSTIGQPTVHH